jgi:hypothetical protein
LASWLPTTARNGISASASLRRTESAPMMSGSVGRRS